MDPLATLWFMEAYPCTSSNTTHACCITTRPISSELTRIAITFGAYMGYCYIEESRFRVRYNRLCELVYSSVIYRCLLVSTAVAPGIRTIVCVLSMIIAGPSNLSPTSSDSNKYTGVSFTRPTRSKYTLYVVSAFLRSTDRVCNFSISENTDSPSVSKVFPMPRT